MVQVCGPLFISWYYFYHPTITVLSWKTLSGFLHWIQREQIFQITVLGQNTLGHVHKLGMQPLYTVCVRLQMHQTWQKPKLEEATCIKDMDLWIASIYTSTTRANVTVGSNVWWHKEHGSGNKPDSPYNHRQGEKGGHWFVLDLHLSATGFIFSLCKIGIISAPAN